MTTTVFSIATKADIEGFLALQSKNLITAIPEEKHSEGFVTTPFTVPQIEELIKNKSLFVAKINNKIVAYVVSAGWIYFSQWPIFAYMVTLFPNFKFHGKQMTIENSYQYGPICVDAEHRGTGIFEDIFQFAKGNMTARYPYALTFINKRNKRSFAAHQKLSEIEVISEFSYNGQDYYILGFLTK
jgi:ABC-type xylose transport system permease subunit